MPKNSSPTRRLMIVYALALLGLFIFLSALDGVKEQQDLARVDTPIAQWLVSHRTPPLTIFMQFITNISAPVFIAIFALIGGIIWAWRKKDIWHPLLFTGAVALGFAITAVIKSLVARSRPPLVDMIPPLEVDFSMPSGHTIGIAVCLLVIGYFIYAKRRNLTTFVIWMLVIITGITTVALSRLYLGYHWATDVTASVGLALIILALVIAVDGLSPKLRLKKLL